MIARPLDQKPEGNSCSWGTAILHLQSVSEKPLFILGDRGDTPGAFLGTFCAHKKYPRGVGPRRPHLAPSFGKAERPLG